MRWPIAALVFLGTSAVIVGVMAAARRGHWSVTAEYLVVVGAMCLGAVVGWLAVRGA